MARRQERFLDVFQVIRRKRKRYGFIIGIDDEAHAVPEALQQDHEGHPEIEAIFRKLLLAIYLPASL